MLSSIVEEYFPGHHENPFIPETQMPTSRYKEIIA